MFVFICFCLVERLVPGLRPFALSPFFTGFFGNFWIFQNNAFNSGQPHLHIPAENFMWRGQLNQLSIFPPFPLLGFFIGKTPQNPPPLRPISAVKAAHDVRFSQVFKTKFCQVLKKYPPYFAVILSQFCTSVDFVGKCDLKKDGTSPPA